MDNTEIEVKGELSSPEPEKPKKKRRWLNIVIDVGIVVFFVASIGFAANVIYLRNYYDATFYVNGMSMYPTLNYGCKTSSGTTATYSSGTEHTPGFEAEFGYAISNRDRFFADLHRMDIVLVYYPDDYKKDGTGEFIRDKNGALVLREDANGKIKRLIGLPGETITIQTADHDDPLGMYNRVWGKTTIVSPSGEETVLKPLYGPRDFIGDTSRYYAYPTSPGAYAHVTLAEDQYYVMGDNRGYSSDSRQKGPITKEMVQAKAYIIAGKTVVTDMGNDQNFPISHYFAPWNYRRIS